jgi:hypothetical protein
MRLGLRAGALAVLAGVALAGACGGGGGAADAGAQPDGAGDVASGGDGSGGAVDCPGTCAGIATICEGMSTIDENWLSICRQNCEVRVLLEPDVARLEQACVAAAVDCATAVLCSVDPLGSRG